MMSQPMCLAAAKQTICGQVKFNKDERQIMLKTTSIDLRGFMNFFPKGLGLTEGKISINSLLNFDANWRPSGSFDLQLS
ncbi:hypothetical protein ACXYUI_27870, partial [Klebsiella pneumoniae]